MSGLAGSVHRACSGQPSCNSLAYGSKGRTCRRQEHGSSPFASGLIAWGSEGKDAHYLSNPRRLLGKPHEGDRKLLLYMA